MSPYRLIHTGAEVDSAITRMLEATSILNYGSAGQGGDDTAIFLSAAGRAIYVPNGTYYMNLTLSPDTSIIGESRRGVIFRPYSSGSPVLTIVGEIGVDHEMGYYGFFTINGKNSSDQVVTGLDGMHIGGNFNADNEDLSRTVFEQIYVHNAGLDGIHLESATNCTFDNLYVQDCGRYGFFIDNESNVQCNTFINCCSRQNHTGMYWGSGNNQKFIGCSFDSNRNCGLYLSRRFSSGFAHSNFDACWAENNGHNPTRTSSGSGSAVIPAWPVAGRAQIFFDGVSTTSADVDGIVLGQLVLPANILFTNCTFTGIAGAPLEENAFSYDICADRAQNVVFDRCKFTKPFRGGYTTQKFRFGNSLGPVHILLRQCGSLNEMPTPTMYASFPAPTILAGGSTQGSYGLIYEFWWKGRAYSNRRIFGLAGSPVGSLTPGYEGEIIKDTTNHIAYLASGITNSDWTPLSGGITGDYTPTLTNSANITSSTVLGFHYFRVGNMVHVYGRVEIDATLATTTLLHISLPVASNLGSDDTLVGHGTSWRTGAGIESAVMFADGTSDDAKLLYAAVDLTARDWFVSFTYKVI